VGEALARLTDGLLIVALFAVPACFAGRNPIGQLLVASLAGALAVVWSMRQLVARDPFWQSTRALWLWLAGAGLVGVQLAPLPQTWRERVSPELSRLLPLWSSEGEGLLPAVWTTLSLDPAETTSGLVTYLSYAILFLIVLQRVRRHDDAAWLLKIIACSGSAVAIFALLQYFFSNGRFFWYYQHPTVSTDETALGPFTNRNHLAQFLALTIGPTLWWLCEVCGSPSQDRPVGFSGASRPRRLIIGVLACGLGAMLLAGLLSLSRAGVAAMGVSVLAGLALLSRRGHLPAKIIPMVLMIGAVVGGAVCATNYHLLADRFDTMVPDERALIWAANMRLARRFPWFGTGVGTHVYSHALEVDRIDDNREFTHAESGYLQVASECGFVGLGLALLMIAVCLNWCRIAYRAGATPASTAMAGAILASLTANLLHAFVDFFWYAPGCMVVVTVLAACACRLAQLANASSESARHAPRVAWSLAVCGAMVLAAWMIAVKLPGALAEPHYTAFLNLQYHAADLEDEPDELERLRLAEIVAAARANPNDSRLQLIAASTYVRMFHLRQEENENPLSLDQLRDAAIASEFPSTQALQEWLKSAVGSNRKYLMAARHYARRSVLACPLEGRGYLYLARLDFLRDPRARLADALHQQALAVRPYEAMVDFELGKTALWRGDLETAMTFFRKAFRRSPVYRKDIAAALAGNFSAEELLERLEPDWYGLLALVSAFRDAGLDDDLPLLRAKYAAASLVQARKLSGSMSEYAWKEAIRMFEEGGQWQRAKRTAAAALEHHSQSLELRQTLGKLLLREGDYAGAAAHLQWAALRAPEDAALQQLAEKAVREKLRHDDMAERDVPETDRALR
jgi:O-antigen ligase/Flp pilus assembly protein TadD